MLLLVLLGIAAASQAPATRPAPQRAPTPPTPQPSPQASPQPTQRRARRQARPAQAPAQAVNEARAAVDSILQQSREVPTTPTTPASAPTRSQEVIDARAAVDSILQQSREPSMPAKLTPNETARALALHLRKTGSFGSKRKPDPIVAQAQRDLDVSPADGVVGPATRAAARRAGVTLPSRG
jgi:ATP-dependent exoDNAse (exonuclease V) beta subunit